MSVTVVAVDSPGVPNKSKVFSTESSLTSSWDNIPFSTAFAFTFSRSIPLPSSSILIAICSPIWYADNFIFPDSDFFNFFLSEGLSIP